MTEPEKHRPGHVRPRMGIRLPSPWIQNDRDVISHWNNSIWAGSMTRLMGSSGKQFLYIEKFKSKKQKCITRFGDGLEGILRISASTGHWGERVKTLESTTSVTPKALEGRDPGPGGTWVRVRIPGCSPPNCLLLCTLFSCFKYQFTNMLNRGVSRTSLIRFPWE